jgi:peroxiredoxin
MARTPSTMKLSLGDAAPYFELPDINERIVKLSDFKKTKGLLVIFACNHCPYVIHVKDEISKLAQDYLHEGISIVAINSNDVSAYPADSPANMKTFAQQNHWNFPYLFDETQSAAKAYKAACTPDIFLFNQDHKLIYRGQLDDSRPGNGISVTGKDLRAALDGLVAGQPIPTLQKPSLGCNIKWKPGNEPDYFATPVSA